MSSIEKRVENLERNQEEVLKLLRPISETYRTVSTLGKWLTASLVFISILIGVIAGLKNLWTK